MPKQSLYQKFMDNDSWIGPRPEPETIQPNRLDAHYVGRAVQTLREDTADAIQCCMTPTGFKADLWKQNEHEWARKTVDKIFAETFAEPISPKAIH